MTMECTTLIRYRSQAELEQAVSRARARVKATPGGETGGTSAEGYLALPVPDGQLLVEYKSAAQIGSAMLGLLSTTSGKRASTDTCQSVHALVNPFFEGVVPELTAIERTEAHDPQVVISVAPDKEPFWPWFVAPIWGLISTASMAASAYHGYKRNDSLFWALVWGGCGAIFPVITPTIGFAQGFAIRKK